MPKSLIDFGAFRREHRERVAGHEFGEPIVVDLNEVEADDPAYDPRSRYELPAIMPGVLPLEYERIMRTYKTNDDIPEHEIFALGEAMFPPAILRDLIDRQKLDAYELGALIMMLFGEYSSRIEQREEPEGNGQRPKKGRSRSRSTSSKTGKSSKRTSSASTASI